MKQLRLLALSVSVPFAALVFFFILQGMFGGKIFFLIPSSVFFLFGAYYLLKDDLTQALAYAIAYAFFVQYFMWDRSTPLVLSMFAALLVPRLLLPFVSQVDVEIGRVVTIASGLVVFIAIQGFLLRIPFATGFIFFIVGVAVLVFSVKARSIKRTSHSYDQ